MWFKQLGIIVKKLFPTKMLTLLTLKNKLEVEIKVIVYVR